MGLGEPGGLRGGPALPRPGVGVQAVADPAVLGDEAVVARGGVEALLADGAQHEGGVMAGLLPEGLVQAPEEVDRLPVPGPAQVGGQVSQAPQGGGDGGGDGEGTERTGDHRRAGPFCLACPLRPGLWPVPSDRVSGLSLRPSPKDPGPQSVSLCPLAGGPGSWEQGGTYYSDWRVKDSVVGPRACGAHPGLPRPVAPAGRLRPVAAAPPAGGRGRGP